MRVLAVIFCLFLSVNALAQTGNEPLYVVDGKIVPSIKDLKPHDIYETALLSDSTAMNIYGKQGANGAMVVTTMKGQAVIYEKKLIPFSEKYKNYLDKKGNDDNLSYVINNTMLIARTKHSVEELSELDPANIKKVEFKTVRQFKTDATVVITTNNDDQ
ncbi:hypothetical protein [Mucilaginibacter sp.]